MVRKQSALPGQFIPKRSLPTSMVRPNTSFRRSKSILPSSVRASGNSRRSSACLSPAMSSERRSRRSGSVGTAATAGLLLDFSAGVIVIHSNKLPSDHEQVFPLGFLGQPPADVVQQAVLLAFQVAGGRVKLLPGLVALRFKLPELPLKVKLCRQIRGAPGLFLQFLDFRVQLVKVRLQ